MYPEVNNKNRVYLISSLFEVLEVLKVPKVKPAIKLETLIEPEKFNQVMIWEFFGPEDNAPAVGTKVQIKMTHCHLLKQLGPLPEYVRDFVPGRFKQEQAQRQAMYQVFKENFNPQLVAEVKNKLAELVNDDEVSYRCFYNSFKMYRCQEYVQEMAQMLISLALQQPFTGETNEELITKMTELHFDNVLLVSLRAVLGCGFEMNRNNQAAWAQDSQVLFSGYFLFQKAVDYLVRFCERMNNQTTFLQDDQRGFLTWDEAGAMMVWGGIAHLRSSDDAVREQFRKDFAAKK